MNPHYDYLLILAGTLAVPLLLSFDKKVAFYKKWKWLFPAMLFPAACYIAWDIYFTAEGVWSFNSGHITGIKLINLPIEEVLFFFIVPYCCVFIYECLRTYFPKLANSYGSKTILLILAFLLLIGGIFFYEKLYTSWTFVLTAGFILIICTAGKYFKSFNPGLFLVAYAVILIPFLIVNGLLTSIPVVEYNDVENLGIRITSIPVEDIFYGMLLFLMNIVIYEKLKNN